MSQKLKTRRAGFRWTDTDRVILFHILGFHQTTEAGFIELCASIGRSPRAVLEFMRRHEQFHSYIKRLPFTPGEIENLSAEMAVTVRKKDPSIKWDRRPRVRFQMVGTR